MLLAEIVRRFGLLILGAALLIVGIVVLAVNPGLSSASAASPIVGIMLAALGLVSATVWLILRNRADKNGRNTEGRDTDASDS